MHRTFGLGARLGLVLGVVAASLFVGSTVASAGAPPTALIPCYRHAFYPAPAPADPFKYQVLASYDSPHLRIDYVPGAGPEVVSNNNALFGLDNTQLLRGSGTTLDGKSRCLTVNRGMPFVRYDGWFTASASKNKFYPKDYTPSLDNPMDDFRKKLVNAIYILHPPGAAKKDFIEIRVPSKDATASNLGVLSVAGNDSTNQEIIDGNVGDPSPAKHRKGLTADDPVFNNTVSLDSTNLAGGSWVIDTGWELSARHCDGLGTDETTHCLPKGDSILIPGTAFKISG